MFGFFEEYLSEFILLFGIAILRFFGRNETADKLKAKLEKKKKKLEKRVTQEAKQLELDVEKLEKLNKEG